MLIHEGGFPTGDYNECPGISGPIVDIVRKLDRAVDLVVSGHTHQAYVCVIDGRLVTSGDKFGTLVTAIELKLDPKTRDVVSAKADNLIVRTATLAKDPEQTALLAAYDRSPRRSPIAPPARSRRRCHAAERRPARARSARSSPMPSWPRPARRPMAAP